MYCFMEELLFSPCVTCTYSCSVCPQLPRSGTRLPSPDVCYISRHWLYLLKHFSSPGPILQYEYACKHGAVVPEKAERARELAMCIRREVWEDLEKKHGGGPFVPRLEACTVCQVGTTLNCAVMIFRQVLIDVGNGIVLSGWNPHW